MSRVVITLKANMNPDADLEKAKKIITDKITKFGGETGKVEIEEVAFGIKAIKFIFILDESKGGTEDLENKIENLDEVSSVEITDVRRTIG